jgi:hypothetical protein
VMSIPFYTRIALLGLGIYLAFVVGLFAVTLALQPSEWEYPLIVGGIAGGVALTIYLWRPWGLVVGIAVGLIGITFSLDSFSENVGSPDSFFDFAYRPVFALAGTLLLLGGSSAGAVQHFRHRTSTQGPRPVVAAVFGVLAVVVILSVTSAILTFSGVDKISAAEREGATTISAVDFKFDQSSLGVSSEGTARLVLSNRDFIVHTFTIEELDVDTKIGPRGERFVVLKSPPPGTYQFFCRITGHEAMRGTLHVR